MNLENEITKLKSSDEQKDRTDLSKFIGLDGEITPDGFKIRNKKSSDEE